MLESLIQFDHQLFFAINKGLSNPFFDWIMPYLRNRYFWMPLYLFLVVFLARNYGKWGWICLLFIVLTFGLCDFFSASIVKPAFERLRPCNDISIKDEMILRVGCGSGFSFPSTHATNHFGIAMFLVGTFYSRWKWIAPLAFLWAFSICLAQVYVGVHFPVDVTTGAILGCLIGYLTSTIFLTIKFEKQWKSGS
ncbi:phosphatase PAP2 family protein [Paradesertivirga mongoliensis]|uniref:Phosphatase PAP2 family protein n=1 Tax=Paradesertivirga mongoliensis TaxID=2100740 RepID=A0ABW4ZM66_9SPHI|nr:phosphatase PAP2 family protein [Pedobacter mongoliensis]